MKVIQSLLAVSVLAVAGAANAATVSTYTAASTTSISGATTGSGTASGTAILDDSGVLTLTLSGRTVTGFTDTTNDSTTTFNGSYSTGTFTPTSGSMLITACTNNGGPVDGCQFAGPGSTTTFSSVSGSANLTSGSIDTVSSSNGATVNSTYTISDGTGSAPAVPVPAAAWLFGSGLLGLAGTARRRRNKEV